eukprot:TRINITY_DN433_c0_g1_i12.p1 TRINITY_DN433_c0_g1~~TRINITY_DN433_c0_g1_i12.p1  ORF type:complete len:108 (-),score=14.34 TRINITY_DN433_c0_g1_i12:211-534(-)
MENLPGMKFELGSQLLWGFSFFLSFYGFFLETEETPYFYGPVGLTDQCWISDDFPAERMYLHYMWMFVSLGVMIILTSINIGYLCTNSFGELDKKVNRMILTLLLCQ